MPDDELEIPEQSKLKAKDLQNREDDPKPLTRETDSIVNDSIRKPPDIKKEEQQASKEK